MVTAAAASATDDQRRRVGPLFWWSVAVALFGMVAFSFAGMPLLMAYPAACGYLVIVIVWLVAIIGAFVGHRRRPRGWVAAGVVLAMSVGAILLNLPVKARFAASLPAFDRIVQRAGPPPAELKENDGLEFPVACPKLVGLYVLEDCQTTSGGYLFFDALGNTLVDYAGFAYLPNGPHLDSDAGFELQDLIHLRGDRYIFTASW